jgi:hypothetical protein
MREKLGRWMCHRTTRDEAGQSLIILVVAFFALLVIIGLAVDLGLMYIERIKLGRACDAAALAAAQDLPFEEFAARRAIQYLLENGYDASNTELIVRGPSNAAALSWPAPADSIGTITIDMEAYEDGDLSGSEKDNSADKILVNGQVDVTTNFMQLIGFRTVPVQAQAIAENVSNLDIMIVYDQSGSMNDDTYCYRDSSQNPCYIQGNNEYPAGERLTVPFADWIANPQQPVVYDGREILVAEAEYYSYSTSYGEHPYYRDYYQFPGTFWMLQRVAHSQASGYRYSYDDRRGAHLMHMPHRSSVPGHSSATSAAPRLDYDFTIPNSAPANDTWWVWIRAQCGAYSGSGSRVDSCIVHWGLNGNQRTGESTNYGDFGRRSGTEQGSDGYRWEWVRLGSAPMARGSTVQVNIWGGGSGFRLDKVLLTRHATAPASNTDNAPSFIRNTTPSWNSTTRSAQYQTYVYNSRYGGPADTRGRTGMAISKCNPIYGLRVNVGCTVNGPPGGGCEDLNGDGIINVYEICDNTTDDMFDDQQPIRASKEAAKNFVRRLRAGFDQVGFIAYSTSANWGDRRELNCVKTPKDPATYSGPDVIGVWDPDTGPDPRWVWCYDEREGATGYDMNRDREDSNTHGSVIGAIEDMRANGWTNIADGMHDAMAIIGSGSGHYGRPNAIKVMILLTDGIANRSVSSACYAEDLYQPNSSNSDERRAADCVMYYAQEARDQSIVIYSIGLGLGADGDLLQAAAEETNGRYYFAPKAQDLDRIFQEIADQIFLRLVE